MGENKNVANTCIDVIDQSFIKHGIYPPTAVNMLPYSLFIAKDQRSCINIRNRNHWWNARLIHVRFRKVKVVAGTVKWENKIGCKDKLVELP